MECHRELGCSEEELRTLLSRHLDGELSGAEAEAVEDHLKECARCRDDLAALRGADRTVRHAVCETRASEGFVRRVMAAISGRRRGVRPGGRAVPRWVVWALAAVVAAGAAAAVWALVAWLASEPPEPVRELGLVLPGEVPGLEGPGPRWRLRRAGTRAWTDLEAGAHVAAGTELELAPGGGPGLIERPDGLRVHSAAGARFVVSAGATDSSGLALAEGRALVTRPAAAARFELGLLDPARPKRTADLPAPAAAFDGEASSVLVEVRGDVAVVTAVSEKATLSWAAGAREIALGERAEVTDAEGARAVVRMDLRALDLGFAPPPLRVSPWAQEGGSAAREGRSPFEFALPPRKVLDLGAASGGSAPVVGPDGTVYVLLGPAPARLIAVRGGRVAASAALGGPSVGAPAVERDGSVLVATRGGIRRAPADLSGVEMVAAFGPGDMPRAGPTAAPGGDIYVVLGTGLAAFARDGRLLWRREDVRSGSPPSLSPDGTVHVAAISGKLHALDPRTGEDRAPGSTPVDEPFLSHVAVAPDGTAYAVSASRYLAWRAPDGTGGRAALPASEYVLSPAIAPSGEVLVASSGGVVHRLTARPTEVPARPFYEAGERIARGPIVDATGRVVVWTASGKLVAVEPSGRASSWDLDAQGASAGCVLRDGAVEFVTRDGRLFGR